MRRNTSSSRSVSSSSSLGGAGCGMRVNCRDHALRDRGREQRVAAGDDADRGDELLGRVVLEHEAAGAGAERLVDVLVEVEGREDEDPRGGVGGEDAPGRLEPVELGHADVHQHDGRVEAGGLVDRLEAVARLGDDLDVGLARRAACGSRRGPSTGRRRRARGWSSPVTVEREARAEDEAALGRAARGHLAAVDLDALADADEAVAEAVARRAASAVVADLDAAARRARSGRSRRRGWRARA